MTRPRLTVRTRLTLLYTGLFALCGMIVVAVSDAIVAHMGILGQSRQPTLPSGFPPGRVALCRAHLDTDVIPGCYPYFEYLHQHHLWYLQQQAAQRQRDLTLSHLLQYSLVTLAVVIVLAAVLGWVFAGRALRPVQQITAAARAASERALQLGAQIYGPKYISEFVTSFSQSWQYIPHLEAAWHSGVNPDSAVMKPLVQPTGRIYYAGDWLSYEDAWQHGAIASARQVVTNINTRVLSS